MIINVGVSHRTLCTRVERGQNAVRVVDIALGTAWSTNFYAGAVVAVISHVSATVSGGDGDDVVAIARGIAAGVGCAITS